MMKTLIETYNYHTSCLKNRIFFADFTFLWQNKMPILAYLLIVFLGILLILKSEFRSEISSMRAKRSDELDQGVVFYQDKNEVVIGVLLWNIFNHISVARRVVAENRKFDDLTEVAKLFNMYKGPPQGISEDLNNDENKD